jgi:hypothetical protein
MSAYRSVSFFWTMFNHLRRSLKSDVEKQEASGQQAHSMMEVSCLGGCFVDLPEFPSTSPMII